MVRESGISATKPVFPSYLLPSLNFRFSRRRSTASSADEGQSKSSDDEASGASTAQTTPNNSPPTKDSPLKRESRLSRTEPDTLRCGACSTDLAFASQIISKGFMGRYGRAFLVAPPPSSASKSLLNLRMGRNEHRQLATGWHIVADISCGACSTKLGWKYVDAKESSQKYKVGKFILETERVITHVSWEDLDDEADGLSVGASAEHPHRISSERDHKRASHDGQLESVETEEAIEFDSEDEDECEDIFAGTWDAETVAKRRRSLVPHRKGSIA